MTESGKRAELSDACTRKIFCQAMRISPEIKYESEGGLPLNNASRCSMSESRQVICPAGTSCPFSTASFLTF